MILALSRFSVQDLEEMVKYPRSLADFHQFTTSAVSFSQAALCFATQVLHRRLSLLVLLQSVHGTIKDYFDGLSNPPTMAHSPRMYAPRQYLWLHARHLATFVPLYCRTIPFTKLFRRPELLATEFPAALGPTFVSPATDNVETADSHQSSESSSSDDDEKARVPKNDLISQNWKYKFSSQNSSWDCYGSFDEQRLFSVKFARFRNFFDFAVIWGILESDKLWEIQCWQVADGKD